MSAVGQVLSVGALTNGVVARHNEVAGEFITCIAASERGAVALKDTQGVEWLVEEEVRACNLRSATHSACPQLDPHGFLALQRHSRGWVNLVKWLGRWTSSR